MQRLFLFYYNFVENFLHLVRLKTFFVQKVKLSKPIIFDIGAHKGKTLNLFKTVYQKGIFFCFEPNLTAYNYLKKNFLSKKIKFYKLAIGNKNQKKKMRINFLDLTNSLSNINLNSKYLKFKNFILSKKKNLAQTVKVNVIKLDSFCAKNKINKIDVLKIDTEGFELKVLQGANKILNNTSYILIEIQNNKMYADYSKKKIESFLANKNFKLIKRFKFPLMFFEDRVYKKK